MKTKAYLSTALVSSVVLTIAIASTYFLTSYTAKVSSEETAGIVRRLDDMGDDAEAKIVWDKINAEAERLIERPVQREVIANAKRSEVSQVERQPVLASAFAGVEEVDLKLADALNTKVFKRALRENEFSGSLSFRDGNIESLSFELPGGLAIDLSYAQMEGNTFAFDHEGVACRGVVFSTGQGKQRVFMVTLTGGRLEGTRLRFDHTGPVPAGMIDPKKADPTYEGNQQSNVQMAKAPVPAPQGSAQVQSFDDPYEKILHEDRLAQQREVADLAGPEAEEIPVDQLDEQAFSRVTRPNIRSFGSNSEEFEDEYLDYEEVGAELSEDELQAQAEASGFNFNG